MKSRCFVLGFLFVAAACQPSGPTYYQDIAPIMQTHCVACHQDGEIAPFALDNFEMVNALGASIVAEMEARTMPPQNLDNSGSCQTFKDARWVPDEEIALVKAWFDAGALEGDANNAAPLPVAVDEPSLTGALVTANMTEAYVPAPSAEYANDDYRCFFVGEPQTTDKFFNGYTVTPQNPEIFHHMLLFVLTSDEAETQADALEAEDPEAGWTCFGDGGVDDAALLAVWAPGRRSVVYPEGTGVRVPAGHRLVMQVHYNLLGGTPSDLSGLTLSLVDTVEKEAILAPVTNDDFELPPGESNYETSSTFPLFALGIPEIEIHGVFPHMHLLGRQLRYEFFPTLNDQVEPICLAQVNDWQFEWQDTLFYEEPLIVDANNSVRLTCNFDTSSRTEPVTWGDGTQDEMCLVFTYLTLPGGGEFDF